MSAAKDMEYQITRQLLRRREQGAALPADAGCYSPRVDTHPWAERLIAILAVTAGLLIVGSYLEELLWAAVAATTVFTLR